MIKCIATVHNTPIANAPTSWLQYAMLDIFLAPTWYLLAIVPPSWSSCLSSFWKFPVCLSRSKLESKAWFSSASLYLSSSWGLIGLFGAPSTSRNVDISQCECASYEGSAISVLMWRYRDQKKSALGPGQASQQGTICWAQSWAKTRSANAQTSLVCLYLSLSIDQLIFSIVLKPANFILPHKSKITIDMVCH